MRIMVEYSNDYVIKLSLFIYFINLLKKNIWNNVLNMFLLIIVIEIFLGV